MKDSEFTELLNLYLDHEITPADAARLEAEVQSNPARRRVYQDYCRMQKACKMLAADFATEPTPKQNVVAFEQASRVRETRKRFAYLGTFAAAAACVALMFVSQPGSETQTSPQGGGDTIAQSTPAAEPTPVQLVADTAPRASNRPVTTGLTLRSTAQSPEALTLKASVQNDPHFAWMQDVRLAPIQIPNAVEQLRFDVAPANRTEPRTFNSARPFPDDITNISVRYQK